MMTYIKLQTKIAPKSTNKSTCADCPKFKPTGEGRAKAKVDYLGQQIQETRLLLEKSKRRSFLKNQLILKPPF